MDWDSPHTKKHIAEAKAQGCELVGPGKSRAYRTYRLPCKHKREIQVRDVRLGYVFCPICQDKRLRKEAADQNCELLGTGKNSSYRTYKLPCGHEQEVQVSQMRWGDVGCQVCLNARLEEEAATQGFKLLGPGKNKHYRKYRLPCGHEKEAATKHVRTGNVRCQTCIDNKLVSEAQAQACELMGPGKNRHYRKYRLPCGHEQEVATPDMRRSNFRCQACLDNKLKEEAELAGCTILGSGKNAMYRKYRLPCGHEREVTTSEMRSGNFRCQVCLNARLEEEAATQGCKLLGYGRSTANRKYRLPCGHNQEVGTRNMRIGRFRCQSCLDNRFSAEAKAQGSELLGEGRDANYRTYRLECGHEQETRIDSMRTGSFRCQTCEDWAFTQPSQAYLLHIKIGLDEWLKLGFAKSIDLRVSQYGLPSEAVVSVLVTKPFGTGKEAREFEQSLHKKYKRKRLKASEMAAFHSNSGATECYPVTLVDQLTADFQDRN